MPGSREGWRTPAEPADGETPVTATDDVGTATDPVHQVPPYHRPGSRVAQVTMRGVGSRPGGTSGAAVRRPLTTSSAGDPAPDRAEGDTT
jgi:hypothetical protein